MSAPRPTPSEPLSPLAWVIDFLLSNKLVIVILTTLLVVAGLAMAPFRWDLGSLPRDPVPVDALPDVSDNQQIVFTRWPGRSPRDVEDQITYPLTTALLGLPDVKTVRSSSMFGFSSIYVIFEDEVDFYWSRSRVLEKLASLPEGTVPPGVAPTLGPDATALGQVYWYTLEPRDAEGNVVGGAFDLHELRSVQDWNVRLALQAVPGVSEVGSVGGFVREYQIDVDPEAMAASGVGIDQIAKAVSGANLDVGARTLEINQVEYVIRGIGLVDDVSDLEEVVITTRDHVPIRVRDVARVGWGPAARRGVLDKAGSEAVGGVVVVRYGDNPLAVIDAVKAKIAEIAPSLPRRTTADGQEVQLQVVPFYDRTKLIRETLGTLSDALIQQILVTIIVVLVMLRRLQGAILISSLLPVGVLATFVLMKQTGIDANVMALAGIAIAIGTMVDMGIVIIENVTSHLQQAPEATPRHQVVRDAVAEVAPAVITSTATTVIGFLPVFALTEAEGKLFRPLAFTKTFALVSALLLAVVLLPALAQLFLDRRERIGRGLRALLRPGAIFDYVLLALGGLLMWFGQAGVGAVIMLVGALALSTPFLPGRFGRFSPALANAVAVGLLAVVLTETWLPLGPDKSLAANLLFVVVFAGGILAFASFFVYVYDDLLALLLRNKLLFLALPTGMLIFAVFAWLGYAKVAGLDRAQVQRSAFATQMHGVFPGLQDDFMPPFDEGAYLYMPTTTSHASIGQAKELLARMDASIAAIPEVYRVVGKIGRVDSALDPAPVKMVETVVDYVPEYRLDMDGRRMTFRYDEAAATYSRDQEGELIPDPDGRPYRQWRDHIRSPSDIWDEIVKVGRVTGATDAPKLMPIKTRIVMLQTGMRAAVGVKVTGPDLDTIEGFGLDLEKLIKGIPGVKPGTVLADRIVGKPYVEIEIDREAIAHHGLTIAQVQNVIQIAIGGKVLTRTIEGRERYPVRVRYLREERDSIESLSRVLVPAAHGEQIPLEQLATLRYVRGPESIKSEDTFLTSYVTFDADDETSEVEAAERVQDAIAQHIEAGDLVLPAGVSYRMAGTYENKIRSDQRLLVLVPTALAIIFILLYLQFRRVTVTLMIYLGVAVAGAGGFMLLWLYGQPWFLDAEFAGASLRDLFQVGEVRMTVAVWVGFLALVGIATDDGVIMATYLKQQFAAEPPDSIASIRARVRKAGRRRVRACIMTTATTLVALFPVITSTGRGSDLMLPMALPVVGGMAVEFLTLFVVPVLWCLVEELRLRAKQLRQH